MPKYECTLCSSKFGYWKIMDGVIEDMLIMYNFIVIFLGKWENYQRLIGPYHKNSGMSFRLIKSNESPTIFYKVFFSEV